MKYSQLLKILERLKEIKPSKAYSEHSLKIIISAPQLEKSNFDFDNSKNISSKNLLEVSLRTLAFVFSATAVIALAYFATSQLSPLFLPGLNKSKIMAEAEMVNASIDIQLSHIQKFKQTNNESILVLKEVSSDVPAHLNPSVIKDEESKINSAFDKSESLNSSSATSNLNNNLNEILNKISK
jgi:hypothetical protein